MYSDASCLATLQPVSIFLNIHPLSIVITEVAVTGVDLWGYVGERITRLILRRWN